MLLNREYFIHSFNETEDLDDAYQTCKNVIYMVPMSNSEKEKLQRDLDEVYIHFKGINKNAAVG